MVWDEYVVEYLSLAVLGPVHGTYPQSGTLPLADCSCAEWPSTRPDGPLTILTS